MILGYRFQKVKLRISKAGQRVYFNTETDKDFTMLKGIALSVGYEGALYGSTFGFRVDEKEIFDESHEAHLLVYSNDISPNSKMLLFEMPVPVKSSKVEGIYTDSSLQSLLDNASYNPSGGVISRNEVNIKKTYVSGKEVVKFSNFTVDDNLVAYAGSGSGFGGGFGIGAAPAPDPAAQVYYPYDVRVILFLSK